MRIEVDKLDVVGATREEAPGAIEALMQSIKVSRLFAPLIVCPNPEQKGRWIVIAGRRRLAAVRRLGLKTVKCTVRPYNPLQNELLEISENFHRLDLTRAERDRDVIRYAELIRQMATAHEIPRLPPPAEAVPEQQKQARKEDPKGHAPPSANGSKQRGIPRKHKAREPEVIQAIVDQLGISERVAQKILRRADVLDNQQRDILIAKNVTDARLDRICAIESPEARGHVINLLADGLEYQDAMATALEEQFAPEERDLSDTEWLETLPLAHVDVNQKRFRDDARFYRKIQQVRLVFARSIDWDELLKDMGDGGGIYWRRLKRFLECPHPRDWKKCLGCTAGFDRGREHQACLGGGYLLE